MSGMKHFQRWLNGDDNDGEQQDSGDDTLSILNAYDNVNNKAFVSKNVK